MNAVTLDFPGTSQSFHYNHFIPSQPDVLGALKAVTTRLRELDPNGDHWINNNLRRFGFSSAYLSSALSIDVFPFNTSAPPTTINPACLTQSIDPIARPSLARRNDEIDATDSKDSSNPLPDHINETSCNDRVTYLGGAKIKSLAAEENTKTGTSNHIPKSRVEYKQLNRIGPFLDTDYELVGNNFEENDEVKKSTKVIADSKKTASDEKKTEDKNESCHQSPPTGSFLARQKFPIKFINGEEGASHSESDLDDDSDYKDDDEGTESADEFGHDFEQYSRPATPPSSPLNSTRVSDQDSRRYCHKGKSARKTLPSSPISPKRARTYGNDEDRFTSSKVARKSKIASPASTRSRRPAWTDEEQSLLHQLLVERREQEAKLPLLEKKFDNNLWSLMSEQLMGRFNIDRAPMACKNHWGRKGREESGFDERSALKRTTKLATSVQLRKNEK